MSQENVEIVRRYYSAWNEGGTDAARAFWSEEIEWHDALDMPDSGVYRGAESVAAHFRDLGGVLGEMEVNIDSLAPAGDEVLVMLRLHLDARRGGLLLDGRLFLDEESAREAAGLSE
jgi:ketosteroid isomerase-like protein